jgi:hypothetical protein
LVILFKAWSLIDLANERRKEDEDKKQLKKRAHQDDQQSDQPESSKKQRITKNSSNLSVERFAPGSHLARFQKKREACVWCHWKAKEGEVMINKKNPPQSNIACKKCNVALCINADHDCFAEYHQKKL